MEIIEIKISRFSLLFWISCYYNLLFSCFCFSGGILGWDPVRTTCIFSERSYKVFIKNIVKRILLGFDREFYLCLIRMCFKIKNGILKVILWDFFVRWCVVWWFIIHCFAILSWSPWCYRTSTRVMSCGEFHDLSENTCSEYRIPPQNTPEVTKSSKQSGFMRRVLNKYTTRVYPMGPFNRHVGLEDLTVLKVRIPQNYPFFHDFFLIFIEFYRISGGV